jgi:hypothetical protein
MLLLAALSIAPCGVGAAASHPSPAQAAIPRQTYAGAEDAVAALIAAIKADDPTALKGVPCPSAETLISSGDRTADSIGRRHFLDAYSAGHKLVRDDGGRMVLEVGPDDWPLPLPIVQADGRWRFDSAAGAES